MQVFWPGVEVVDNHPASYFPNDEWWSDATDNCAIVVRNPVERFRSMCAHVPGRPLEEHLANPIYGPLPQGNFVRYFRFEDQLNDAAEWLGLPTPLPHEDATDPAAKPALTPDQEALVRQIFAADIALWESI